MESFMDDPVAATNDYATLCKFQAVSLGYYKDEFVNRFLSSRVKNSCYKKAPEINRGYYVRSASIAYIVEQFIDSHEHPQVISLGAGYDSLFWRLKTNDNFKSKDFPFVEIDLPHVTLNKISSIRRYRDLSQHLTNIRYKSNNLHSDYYHIVSFDMRQSDTSSLMTQISTQCNLQLDRPTLCIAECVLIFMPIESSKSIIRCLSKSFRSLSFVNYEQFNMDDRFGNTMMSNMTAQHCDLAGVQACKSMETQLERFKSEGLDKTKEWSLTEIYDNLLFPIERERIEKIEYLDERELLRQLLDHYCIIIASNQNIDWLHDEEYWFSRTCAISQK